MSEVTWIRVSSAGDLHRIAKAKVTGMNTYSATTDKTGAVIIPLGHDSKPDSDWGRYTRGNVIIRVTGGDDLLEAVEIAIRKRLGLPGGAVLFAKVTQ
jgi:hypothetical protein